MKEITSESILEDFLNLVKKLEGANNSKFHKIKQWIYLLKARSLIYKFINKKNVITYSDIITFGGLVDLCKGLKINIDKIKTDTMEIDIGYHKVGTDIIMHMVCLIKYENKSVWFYIDTDYNQKFSIYMEFESEDGSYLDGKKYRKYGLDRIYKNSTSALLNTNIIIFNGAFDILTSIFKIAFENLFDNLKRKYNISKEEMK